MTASEKAHQKEMYLQKKKEGQTKKPHLAVSVSI